MTSIRLHKPEASTTLPAHERAAAARRHRDAKSPAIPGARAARRPRPAAPTGRKTARTDTPTNPGTFGNP